MAPDKNRITPTTAALITALNHPLRRRILRALVDGESASATDLSQQLDVRLGNIAYHMKVLTELKVLWLSGTQQVRGAQERFHRSVLDGKPEWAKTVLDETRKLDESS